MAVETYSYTGDRIATEVENKFGDSGNVQITRAMILVWINNGIRAIASENPFLQGVATANLIQGVSAYELTGQRVANFHTFMVGGKPITLIPFSEFQALIAKADLSESTGTPTTGTIWGGTLTLWPVPDTTTAAGLVCYFYENPADLATITDPLTLPDRFYNALNDYVLAQALELDENFDAAQVKLKHSKEASQRQFEREHGSPSDFYPAMVMDPYDDDLVY